MEAARDTPSTAEMHFLKEQWPWAAAGGSEGASKVLIDLPSPRRMRRGERAHVVPPLVPLLSFLNAACPCCLEDGRNNPAESGA